MRSRSSRHQSMLPPNGNAYGAGANGGAGGSGAAGDSNHKPHHHRDFVREPTVGGFVAQLLNVTIFGSIQDGSMDVTDEAPGKRKHHENPFIEPANGQTVVDMKDVMVLNDIIEQAAGRHSQTSDHGGKE